MAFTAPTVWEVRTTGNGQYGGGFDAAFGGTDYSQQDTPQLALTDCTTSTVSTALSSTGGGFTAAMVGNVVWLGALAADNGRRQIVAYVSSTQVTLDSNAPANRAGVGYANVGGAYKVDQNGFGFAPVDGNKVWVKAGTYTVTVNSVSPATSSVVQPLVIEGYNTTRGDITTTPTLTRPKFKDGGAFAGAIVQPNGVGQIWRNLEVESTGSIFSSVQFNSNNCIMENCLITPDTGSRAVDILGARNVFRRNYVVAGSGNSDAVYARGTGGHVIEFNHLRSSAVGVNNFTGVVDDTGNNFIKNNIIQKFATGILLLSGTLAAATVQQNVLHRCTDGILISNAAQGVVGLISVRSNIFSRNTNALKYSPADISLNAGVIEWMKVVADCNFYYANTNNRVNLPAGSGETVLTADPFTSEGTYDFSLNTATGGGQTVRDTLCVQTWADGINTTRTVGGAGGTPAVSTTVSTSLGTMRSLWRELTGEQDTTEVPNATVDLYLMSGLEALNRRVGYSLTTDPDPVTLVDGTEEYAIPTDCVEIVFVEHNGQPLEKSSIEEWRKEGINWRYGKTGKPAEWAMYGNKLVVYPRPNAQAVAESAYLALRYISTPPSITTSGPDQLCTQDWRVVVYFAVAEWSRSYPDGAFAAKRADDYQTKFEAEAALIAKNYQSRGVTR